MKKDSSKCLTPECERKSKARGLCLPCYKVAGRLVVKEETTWEKLEKAGKIAPRKRKLAANWLLGKE